MSFSQSCLAAIPTLDPMNAGCFAAINCSFLIANQTRVLSDAHASVLSSSCLSVMGTEACAVLPFHAMSNCSAMTAACAAVANFQNVSLACSSSLSSTACSAFGVNAVSFSSNALSLPCLAALTNVSCAVLSREFFGGLKKVQCGQISASCFQFAPSLSALSRDCTSGLGDETLSALSLQQVSTMTNVGFSGLSAHHFVALVKKHGKQKKGEESESSLTPSARSCRAR